jgi:hypothetical protein
MTTALHKMRRLVYKTHRRGVAQPGSAPRSGFSPFTTTTLHQNSLALLLGPFILSLDTASYPCSICVLSGTHAKKVMVARNHRSCLDYILVVQAPHGCRGSHLPMHWAQRKDL